MDCEQATTSTNEDSPAKEEGAIILPNMLKRAYDESDSTVMEPRKKLCRYYYLDHCTKAESCFFMHSEFPCKFYYFGYECKDGKNCKLLHGSALNAENKEALWNHVMSAPANLLQKFPCFPLVLLEKNFNDRHNELVQMEQEGLLLEESCAVKNSVDPVMSNLSCGIIETPCETQVTIDTSTYLRELVGILTPEQIESLVSIGVETVDQLFQLGTSLLSKLGLDSDTLMKFDSFKEERAKSMYTTEIDETKNDQNEMSTSDVFGSESLDVSLTVSGNQPTLTDQELLSILNEDVDTSLSSVECSFTKASEVGDDAEICTKIIDGFQGSQIHKIAELLKEEFDDINAESSGCIIKAFRSDAESECQQLMLYPSVRESESDKKSLESIERTVQQLKKIDSLLTEEKKQDNICSSDESDDSTDNGTRRDSSATESVNLSFGSDSDSQTCFRMPFKSIINRYTPAKEIDASNGKFLKTQYKLIPVEVPKPNFERIRQTFITAPTYSLDPRIQIMFNVGPKEERRSDNSQQIIRDPRLKKSTEDNIVDVAEKIA